MTLSVAGFKAEDGTELHVEQKVDLDNADGFAEYSTAVMINETVSLDIKGDPQLQLGKLPKIGVNYDKTVTMKGMRFSPALIFELRVN